MTHRLETRSIAAAQHVRRLACAYRNAVRVLVSAKRSTLEVALKLSGGTRKHKIRIMDDALLSCPVKAVHVLPKQSYR
jgi:hypothetical protein